MLSEESYEALVKIWGEGAVKVKLCEGLFQSLGNIQVPCHRFPNYFSYGAFY